MKKKKDIEVGKVGGPHSAKETQVKVDKDDLITIIGYLWADEMKDFEGQEDHIFWSLARVAHQCCWYWDEDIAWKIQQLEDKKDNE